MEYKGEETSGKQTEIVIETNCLGEELPEHCVRADEEASSIVLHVGHDVNEKEKKDEEVDEAPAAKETHESNEDISKEDVEIRREKNHTQRGETTIERSEKANENMHQGQKKKNEKTRRDSTITRRLQRDEEHPRNQICQKKSAHHQDKD